MKNKNTKQFIAKLALLFSAVALLANMVSVGVTTAQPIDSTWAVANSSDPEYDPYVLRTASNDLINVYSLDSSDGNEYLRMIKTDSAGVIDTTYGGFTGYVNIAYGTQATVDYNVYDIKETAGGYIAVLYGNTVFGATQSLVSYFHPNGTLIWTSAVLSSYTAGADLYVDGTTDNVYVAWFDIAGGPKDFWLKGYESTGVDLYPATLVRSALNNNVHGPFIIEDGAGEIFLIWGEYDNTALDYKIHAQRYNPLTGTVSASGLAWNIALYSSSTIYDLAATANGAGGFGVAVLWLDGGGTREVRLIVNNGDGVDDTGIVDAPDYDISIDNSIHTISDDISLEADGTGYYIFYNDVGTLSDSDITVVKRGLLESDSTLSTTIADTANNERLIDDASNGYTTTIDSGYIYAEYLDSTAGTIYEIGSDKALATVLTAVSLGTGGPTKAAIDTNGLNTGIISLSENYIFGQLDINGSLHLLSSGGCTPGPNQQCATLTLTGAKDIFYEGYGNPMTGVIFNSLTTESFEQDTVANYAGSSPWPDTAFIGIIDLEGASTVWNLTIQGPTSLVDGAKSINLLPGGGGSGTDKMFAETIGHNFTTGFDLSDNGGTTYPMTFNDGTFDSYDIWYWVSSGYTWLEADVTGPLNVPVGTDLTDSTNYNSGIIDVPVTILSKGANPVLGIFGTGISFMLTVAGGTPAGSYSGDITYTLS